MKKTILLAALCALISEQAQAGRSIPAPYVTEGKHQIFTDGLYGFETEDSSEYKFRERLTTDFGLTDDIGLRLRTVGEQDPAEGFRNTQLETAIRYEIGNKGEYDIDSGLYFALLQNTTDNHDSYFQFRYLAGKETEHWKSVGNVVLQKKFGDELSTTTMAINFGSLRKLDEVYGLGFQYYGNYGKFEELQIRDNKHSFGPWVNYTQPTYSTDFTLQFGITDEERDVTLQWRFTVPFTTDDLSR